MREGLTLHSDGNCRLFHFKKEAWKLCRITLPRCLELRWRIPGRQVHFIKSLTSYCRSVVTCYKNAPAAGSHTLYCDVLMSTYRCALVRYGVMPAETAQSAELLRAVMYCDKFAEQRDSNFRKPHSETASRNRSVPSPTNTGGNLSQKM
jgi:hypothetical protein